MIRGIYTSAAGMVADLTRQQTIIHNLANVRTIGYKADQTTLTDFPSLLLTQIRDGAPGAAVGRAGTGVALASLSTDFSEGAMKLTDHPFDFAIAGDGFFQLQTPDGVRYTRDGRFHRDVDGRLITSDGYAVLGRDGPLTLPDGFMTVSSTGVIFIEGEEVGQLSLARFEDPGVLVKDGQTMFAGQGETPALVPPDAIRVHQGYLEESNVDMAQMATEMQSVLRAYQLNQRLVQLQDRINEQATTQLGRI